MCEKEWSEFESKGDIMEDPIELIQHYFEAIIEQPLFKSAIAGGIITFEYLFGTFGNPLQLLLLVVLIDMITGVAKVTDDKIEINGHSYLHFIMKFTSTLTSKGMRNGMWKVIEYMAAVFLANALAISLNTPPIRTYIITVLVVTEMISIVENLKCMGYEIPYFTPEKLKKIKKKVDIINYINGGDNDE